MSRRKQSKPRQIKRSIGDLDTGDENPPDDLSLSGDEGGASDLEDSAELDGCSPPSLTPLATEGPRTQDGLLGPEEEEEEEEEEEDRGPTHSAEEEEDMEMEMEAEGDGESHWMGPDELELSEGADGFKVLAARDLPADTLWGPYTGAIQSEEPSNAASANEVPLLTLMCLDVHCWLSKVPVALEPTEANCSIYSQGEELYCKLTRKVCHGGALVASLSCPPLQKTVATQSQGASVKEEPASGVYPAALHSEIQLLPQQAGMAAILATAVVNKDIFPCKDCGIWYRSERNLHAHLMYYCASRQKQPSQEASSPPQDSKGTKESYPHERVCPFPQCQKSCPSASSLEIHMRTHSGERPFMCLICLSAFTTKANCERHLKVHTDTLSGVCHGCGFISTTRDILYSHLVTSHMACQPGGRPEVYSPGPATAKLPLAAGLSPGDSGIVLKCQVCGAAADTPALLQQHVRTHLEERMHTDHSPTPRQGANHSNTTTNITSTSSTTSSSSSSSTHHHHHHHLQDRESATGVPRPNSSSPGTNGGSATPCGGCSPPDGVVGVRVKEEPQSDVEHDAGGSERDAGEDDRVGGGGMAQQHHHHGDHHRGSSGSGSGGDSSSSQKSTSPKSPVGGVAVKAEPTSPTPGCSPAHSSSPGGSALPGGAVFLPQYVFGSEASAAMMPQASEILAKMSEMVHSRLKQGHGQLAATAAAAAAVAAAAAAAQAQQAGFFPAGSPAATAAVPPPTAPVHKGATCFECDITFNNINNFYVHKRLYCSSRHHQGEREPQQQQQAAPGSMPKDGTSNPPSASASAAAASPISGSGGASGGSRAASASPNDTESATVGGAEVKSEPRGGSREPGCSSSSEGEGCGGARSVGGRASESSQSPGSGVGSGAGSGAGAGAGAATSATGVVAGPGSVTADDDGGEDDPTRTFCAACNIRFTRHENYLVHKRFYCASRHDPTQQRIPPAAKANAFLPQPIRTRKRKKMYEIHMARTQALAAGAQAMAQAQAQAQAQAAMLSIKQEVTSSSAGTSSANALSGGSVVVAMAMPAKSRSTSPEGEGPIDLSKRPRVRGASRGAGGGSGTGSGGGGLPVLPLSDYHKCTACSISFNSIENYLAHKTYYCPATTLQPHTLEQLQRLKRPASTSPKSLHPHPHAPQEGPLPPKVAAMGKASLGAAVPGAPLPSHPGPGSSEAASVTPPHAAAHAAKPAGGPPVVCPYCPPGRALTTDLVEHLRSTHGLVLTMQPGEGVVMTTVAAAAMAAATGAPPVSPSSSVSPRDTTTTVSPRPSPRSRRDSVNGGPRSSRDPGSPHSPLVNGSPGGASTSGSTSGSISPKSAPQALSPAGALQLTVSSPSSVDTHLRDGGHHPAPLTPPEKPLPLGAVLTPVAAAKAASGVAGVGPMGASTPNAAAMQNGNVRYCRLCNIKFSSLSTFIAHKKYYCSSHSAEHVK